jgi:methionyl-tRNA formyltransferase
MAETNFIVATIKPWNIRLFHEKICQIPGNWTLITDPAELSPEKIREIKPAMIFFPHWSEKVPATVWQETECVCFHMTDLPFGRGGSPLQNLIARGIDATMISALKMTETLDAGPVYLKVPLSLHGLAEEIYLRAAEKIADMIRVIVLENPVPVPQSGEIVKFSRRRPEESRFPQNAAGLRELFDHIRMLDAKGYPKAFVESGNLRLEFSRPALLDDSILADVKITFAERKKND